MFVHLHNHTYYSFLEALASPKDYAKRAQELGQNAIAITDSAGMHGGINFYRTCKEFDIKPILGCQIYVAARRRMDKEPQFDTKRSQMVLLAYNNTGYENLLHLSSKAYMEGMYYKPRVDLELLQHHREGLIALYGGLSNDMARMLLTGRDMEEAYEVAKQFQDIYGQENFFFELQDHPEMSDFPKLNEMMIEMARAKNIPLIVANNSYYARPEDRDAHEILLCVQAGKDFDDPTRFSLRDGDYSLRSEEDLRAAFPGLDEAFANTVTIADRCNVELQFNKVLMPTYKVPEGDNPAMFLRRLCYQGLQFRFLEEFPDQALIDILSDRDQTVKFTAVLQESAPEAIREFMVSTYKPQKLEILKTLTERQLEIIDRLDYELCVINEMGFDCYFLIVQDFINWAKNNDIAVGPGRGSGAGSLVAYALQITDVDPLKYALLFERFLNPARISMPDFDTDFDDTQRERVLNYVVDKYGRDHVAQICTYGTLQAKQAIKDVGRSLGVPYGEMDVFAKLITEKPGTKLKDICENNAEFKMAMAADPMKKRIVDLALKLEGVVRQVSVHACAVLISDKALNTYTALQPSPSDKREGVITQYDAGPLESLGLLKMDFLGLRNLNILKKALKIIQQTRGITIEIDKIPMDDAKAYQLFARGETMGVFQFESAGMRRYLKELEPSEFEDLVAMVALYRPGPMEWIPDYINYKHGRKQVSYPHPALEEVLEVSYGIAIYQEQALRIAQKFAGFSLGEADILRKAIGKKKPEEMAKQKKKFIDGAVTQGHTAAEGVFIFEKVIEPFAGYGFNRSHAVCYALIAYQTGYLKAHYPTEFMAALLTTVEDATDKLIVQIEDCHQLGIEVLPPDVNESDVHFTVTKEFQIRFGLNAIKGFGLEGAEAIVRERTANGSFTSITDFATRIEPKIVNRKALEALTLSGAMDCLGDRKSIFESIDRITEFVRYQSKNADSNQIDIFSLLPEDTNHLNTIELVSVPPATYTEKLQYEKIYLGFYLSGHPLAGLRSYFTDKVRLVEQLDASHIGKKRNIMGLISEVKKITTKKGEQMAMFTIADMTAELACVVFPKSYLQLVRHLLPDSLVIVGGKISERDGALQIMVEEMKRLDLEKIIEKAKEQGQYNPNEKVPLKKRQALVGGATTVRPETPEDAGVPNETIDQKEFLIALSSMEKEYLERLKTFLSKQEQGRTQILLKTKDNKVIKTPYAVTMTDEFNRGLALLEQL